MTDPKAVTVPAEITPDSGNYGALFTPKIYARSDIKILTGEFNFSDSYPATGGGEVMSFDNYFKELLGVILEPKGGYIFEYDYDAKKVKAMHAEYSEDTEDGPLIPVPSVLG